MSMRTILLALGISLGAFCFIALGFIEGGTLASWWINIIGIAYTVGMVIWVWLTISSKTWGGRLGGYIAITIGVVILFFYMKANWF
jgi:hypothetical protein